ncbi:MAG TPA: ATP-dependent helicase [Actinomycetota bacterium]
MEPAAAGGWLEALNAEQRRAVTHVGGPLLIVAGAGTGKTMTLACRVAHLVETGTRPERVLLLTFSRRAAREMVSRAERLTGDRGAGKVWGGTFHAIANRLLRLFGRPVGVRPDFTVLDESDAADLMNWTRGELGLGTRTRRFPRKETLAAIYSRTVNAQTPLGEVLEHRFPWCAEEADGVRAVFDAYTTRKREQNLLDYDDLLLYWRALAGAREGRRAASLFDHVLVDEYQDTNAIQADILFAMHATVPGITVVGDDAQSIYSFRSATVRNILEFAERFPHTTTVTLERNYRSTPEILGATNAAIELSPQRHEKTLRAAREAGRRPLLTTCLDEAEQSDEVCRRILEHREQGTPLRRQAVLFRAGHHSDLLEVELARRNIPFVKYGGLKFLEAAHVKDVLALLRVLDNPWDHVSWFRVLQLMDGVGPAGARRLIGELGADRPAEPGDPGHSPLRRFLDRPPAVPAAAVAHADRLRAALSDCAGDPEPAPATQIERLGVFCEPVFRRIYPSAESRLRDVEQLELLASGYRSRATFVVELTLDPPTGTGDLAGPPLLDEDYVILSTIHSAKGCEWDVVHLIHASDGMIPSDLATGDADEIEEERRLLYVALTRARDALYVTFPLRYYRRPRGLEDPHHYAQLTRFLPDSVRERFDQRSTVTETSDPAGDGGPVAVPAAVDEFLAGLWRA